MYVCACVEEIRFPKSVISVKTREKMRGREEGKREEGMWKNCTIFFFVIRGAKLWTKMKFSPLHMLTLCLFLLPHSS